MPNDTSNEGPLMLEGARSYLEATTAIAHFQRAVQRKCCAVMDRHLDDYTSALGIDSVGIHLNRNDIEEIAWPIKMNEPWASIGARLKSLAIPRFRHWETYCSLEWRLTDPQLFCYVGEWLPSRTIADTLFKRFRHAKASNVIIEDSEVGITTKLTPDEAVDFPARLENLLQQWIGLWKQVGGIETLFTE